MNRKEGFFKRTGDFMAGRGFYVVLLLCVAVIGVSAWALLGGDATEEDMLSLPVVGEVEDLAQQPPGVPTMGEATRPRPPVTPRPGNQETFFGRGDPEEVPETPEEVPVPEETPPPPEQPAVQEPLQFVWPVGGRVEVYHSMDQLIFDRTMGDWRTHAGMDIAAELGEPVLAVAAGTVERIYHHDLLGTTVVISHGNGLQSLYANLAEVPVVEEGQWVGMGTPIGAVGTTALAKSGVVHHLHLEMIEDGVQVDPLEFLPER